MSQSDSAKTVLYYRNSNRKGTVSEVSAYQWMHNHSKWHQLVSRVLYLTTMMLTMNARALWVTHGGLQTLRHQ